ncbi:hypothetical protein PR202_ga12953 [Eleusine coracana subsp. coracana]|uniref:Uncharacterized protein n=1 Tax=Eleusine coracana subsp. coracana TaxID=191504 RepID=A0AAV5CDG1_ELECO|nr:hypothetical protein PR202_ga12953 [Eleusine coracana subsp. coracana]
MGDPSRGSLDPEDPACGTVSERLLHAASRKRVWVVQAGVGCSWPVDGSVLLSKLVTQGVALCGFQMTRTESATVEEAFLGKASAPIAGTSSGSCAQMKMRIRSLLAGTLTTILMDEHGFELFQHDGWRYTTGLHHRGFPTLLWEMLRALGYEEQPSYRGRETRRHGVPFAEVHLSVSPHPRNPDLAGMESTVTAGSLREGLERVAHQALTHFCGRNVAALSGTPFEMIPIWHQADPVWQRRVRRVSRDDYPEYHAAGYHRVAHYSEYLLNLDEESSRRSRVLLTDAEQVWLQRNDLQTQQQLASAQQEMDLMGEDLETLIHENQDLQAQLDAVAAPQAAAPAEEEPEEDARAKSPTWTTSHSLRPARTDQGPLAPPEWCAPVTPMSCMASSPKVPGLEETDSPLGTPPPPPPSNPMQMMAQFFASMMESQQQQAEFMREVAQAKPSNS